MFSQKYHGLDYSNEQRAPRQLEQQRTEPEQPQPTEPVEDEQLEPLDLTVKGSSRAPLENELESVESVSNHSDTVTAAISEDSESSSENTVELTEQFTCGKGCSEFKCSSWHALYAHYGTKHHECRYCYEAAFDDHAKFEEHIITYHREHGRYYNCRYCSENFESPIELAEHRWFHPSHRPYYCEKCQRHYSNLVDHKKNCLHRYKLIMSNRSYKCTECPKFCKGIDEYQFHFQQQHYRYICQLCIGQKLPTRGHQKAHMRRHPKCQYCLYRIFDSTKDEHEHIQDDHCGPPFECPGCADNFQNLQDLGKHVRVNHHEVLRKSNIYCRLCECELSSAQMFLQHGGGLEHKMSMMAAAARNFPTSTH